LAEKLHAANSLTSEVAHTVAASFQLPEYGHYRVEVETVQDQSIFKNVNATLIIDKYSPTGK
jgi:hypothetical protein